MTGVGPYAIVATVLFGLGLYGAMVRRHAIAVLISIELMLNAASLNFVSFSRLWSATAGAPGQLSGAGTGQLFAIFIITVAAAEAIVGLALILALFRSYKTGALDRFSLLKW